MPNEKPDNLAAEARLEHIKEVIKILHLNKGMEINRFKKLVREEILGPEKAGATGFNLKLEDKNTLLSQAFEYEYNNRKNNDKDFSLTKKLLSAFGGRINITIEGKNIENVNFLILMENSGVNFIINSCNVKNCIFPPISGASDINPGTLKLSTHESTFENCTFYNKPNPKIFVTSELNNCKLRLNNIMKPEEPVSKNALENARIEFLEDRFSPEDKKEYIINEFYNGKNPNPVNTISDYKVNMPGLLEAIKSNNIKNYKEVFGMLKNFIVHKETNRPIQNSLLEETFLKKNSSYEELNNPEAARKIVVNILDTLNVDYKKALDMSEAISEQQQVYIKQVLSKDGETSPSPAQVNELSGVGKHLYEYMQKQVLAEEAKNKKKPKGKITQAQDEKLSDFAEYLSSVKGYKFDSVIEATLMNLHKEEAGEHVVSLKDIGNFKTLMDLGLLSKEKFISFLEVLEPNKKQFPLEAGKGISKNKLYDNEKKGKKYEWIETHLADDKFMKDLSFSAVFLVKYLKADTEEFKSANPVMEFLTKLRDEKIITKKDFEQLSLANNTLFACGEEIKKFGVKERGFLFRSIRDKGDSGHYQE